MFFGVVYNAASSVATTVNGLITGLVFNVIQAYRPVIIKSYAAGQVKELQNNMNNALKYMLLIFGLMFTPFYLEAPFLFKLWLVQVPVGTIVFCRLLMVASVFGLINSIITITIHATGRIKGLSLATGSLFLMMLPTLYVFYRLGFPVQSAYKVMIATNGLILASNMIINKRLIPSLNVFQLIRSIIASLIVVCIASIVTIGASNMMTESFWRVIFISITHVTSVAVITFFFILDMSSRQKILNQICQRFQ